MLSIGVTNSTKGELENRYQIKKLMKRNKVLCKDLDAGRLCILRGKEGKWIINLRHKCEVICLLGIIYNYVNI